MVRTGSECLVTAGMKQRFGSLRKTILHFLYFLLLGQQIENVWVSLHLITVFYIAFET